MKEYAIGTEGIDILKDVVSKIKEYTKLGENLDDSLQISSRLSLQGIEKNYVGLLIGQRLFKDYYFENLMALKDQSCDITTKIYRHGEGSLLTQFLLKPIQKNREKKIMTLKATKHEFADIIAAEKIILSDMSGQEREGILTSSIHHIMTTYFYVTEAGKFKDKEASVRAFNLSIENANRQLTKHLP